MSENSQIDPRKGSGGNPDKRKPPKKPSKQECLQALDDLNTLLHSNEPNDHPRRLHKTREIYNPETNKFYKTNLITKGVITRHRQLRGDSGNLYYNQPEGKNSYKGHQTAYNSMRTALQQTLNLVEGGCKDEINRWLAEQTPEVRAKTAQLIAEAKKWVRTNAPEAPDKVLQGETPNPKPAPAPTPSSDQPSEWSLPTIDLWWVPAGAGALWRMFQPIEGQGVPLGNRESLPQANNNPTDNLTAQTGVNGSTQNPNQSLSRNNLTVQNQFVPTAKQPNPSTATSETMEKLRAMLRTAQGSAAPESSSDRNRGSTRAQQQADAIAQELAKSGVYPGNPEFNDYFRNVAKAIKQNGGSINLAEVLTAANIPQSQQIQGM
jgi:hypothetical protein